MVSGPLSAGRTLEQRGVAAYAVECPQVACGVEGQSCHHDIVLVAGRHGGCHGQRRVVDVVVCHESTVLELIDAAHRAHEHVALVERIDSQSIEVFV